MNPRIATGILIFPLGLISLIANPVSARETASRTLVKQEPLVVAQTYHREYDQHQEAREAARQAEVRRDEIRQAEIRRDEIRQAEIRRDEIRQAEIRQAEIRRNAPRRVWIPGHWESGFLGIGRKWVEGHWETV